MSAKWIVSVTVVSLGVAPAVRGEKANVRARALLAETVEQVPFTFALVSDTHVGCQRPDGACSPALGDCSCYDRIRYLLANIAAQPVLPRFVICCGDLTHFSFDGNYASFQDRVIDWMESTHVPVFSIPGNHDMYSTCPFEKGGHAGYKDHIDDVRYSGDYEYFDYKFDYAGCRFVLLDNVQKIDTYDWADEAKFTATQQEKLNTWLSTAPANRFMAAHVPPYVLPDNPGYAALDQLAIVHDVRAGFFGHKHRYCQKPLTTATNRFEVDNGCDPGDSTTLTGWLRVTVFGVPSAATEYMVEQHAWHNDTGTWTTTCRYVPRILTVDAPLHISGQADTELVASERIKIGASILAAPGCRAKLLVRQPLPRDCP